MLSRNVTMTICFSYQNPTTLKEFNIGTISLNVLAGLEAGQQVKVEWKGLTNALLKGAGRSIVFTGEKL